MTLTWLVQTEVDVVGCTLLSSRAYGNVEKSLSNMVSCLDFLFKVIELQYLSIA
jgi:hypothetical protein